MRWLIVEDALRDRTGHWFEYIRTFCEALPQLGDDVTVLADEAAEGFLRRELQAQPVLPPSIWHRMSDGAPFWRRYCRIPNHAWKTVGRVSMWFKVKELPDIVFVPTILLHHLLGWVWLTKGPLSGRESRILLFFTIAPVNFNQRSKQATWVPAPTAIAFRLLVRSLHDDVKQGRVILGAETKPMCDTLTRLCRVPFVYFPHPVTPLRNGEAKEVPEEPIDLVLGFYGGARSEKGVDLLIEAIDRFLLSYPDSRVTFALQCVGGRPEDWGRIASSKKVRLIGAYFEDGGYLKNLCSTDVLLLPYQRSSYALRLSRIAVEAMVHGIPFITTRGTTMAQQAENYGAAVLFEENHVEGLVKAIRDSETRHKDLLRLAQDRMSLAQEHFSVAEFRRTLRCAPDYEKPFAVEQSHLHPPRGRRRGSIP